MGATLSRMGEIYRKIRNGFGIVLMVLCPLFGWLLVSAVDRSQISRHGEGIPAELRGLGILMGAVSAFVAGASTVLWAILEPRLAEFVKRF